MGNFLGRSRYRQISFFFALMLTGVTVSSFAFRIIQNYDFALHDFGVDRGRLLFFAIVFWILVFVRESDTTHILQIVLLMAVGIVSVFYVAPKDLGGDLAFLLAGALAYRYGLLETRRTLRLSLIMGPLVLTRIAAVVYYPDIHWNRALNQIIIVASGAPFLYVVFERDFLRVSHDKQVLETEFEHNRPFVEFGRNVSGIVHDFKNDLALFSSFSQLMRVFEGEPLDTRHIDQLDGYIDRFRRRIERLLFVTRRRGRREMNEFDLEEAVRAALYVFETSTEFRREIAFSCRCPAQFTRIRSNPDELLTILENLIRNSCEALIKSRREGGVDLRKTSRIDLAIDTTDDPGRIAVVIEDNGPGMPICDEDDGQECVERLDALLEKKPRGVSFGIGLENVRRAAERIGAVVRLHSVRNHGVRAVVEIPVASFTAVAVDS